MKKIAAALTALLCLCGSIPVIAEESAPITGTYEGLDWTLENHVLTISGDTNIYCCPDSFPDNDILEFPDWNEYSEDIYEIIIEEGVTGADEYALSGYPNLTKLTLPSTFAYLEPYALYDNPQLSEINGLEHVKEFHFECLGNTAYIKTNPFVIFDGVLRYAEGTDLNVPEGVKEIAPYAFGNLAKMEELYQITLPDDLEVIDDCAFAWCATITDINIPDSVQRIGNGAFMFCANLGNITLGENVASIGQLAFYNCKSLQNLTVLGDTVFDAHAYGEGMNWMAEYEQQYQDGEITEEDLEEIRTALEEEPLGMDIAYASFVLHFFGTHPYNYDMEFDTEYDIEENTSFTVGSIADHAITGHTGSDAQRYAEEYGIPFQSLDEALMPGDLNGNGEIDIVDVIILNKNLLLGTSLTPAQQLAADFDGNGEINATDSLAILKAVVKIQ